MDDNLIRFVWNDAIEFLKSEGYEDEAGEFEDVKPPKSANEFLADYTWVVFASGFSEKILEEKWDNIEKEFFNFNIEKIINTINDNPNYFIEKKMPINNKRKIKAIVETANRLKNVNFTIFFNIEKMKELPYIGNVTKFHLARNLGLNVGKPDRWIIRLAENLGFSPDQNGVKNMFEIFHSATGEKIGKIDVVLWRASQLGWKPKNRKG